MLFHTINRNKESFTADLKNADDIIIIKTDRKGDVLIHNFRPGVMDKLGLDYESVKEINPRLIYAEISGYGKEGPWKNKPGQDLLFQSMTGFAYTTGNGNNGPVPFGIAVGDILSGCAISTRNYSRIDQKTKNRNRCFDRNKPDGISARFPV